MMRLQQLVAARRRASGDEGMAMVLAILLIMLVAGLSISMGALVIAESRPTQFARKNAATVNAAQAGLQVGLDRLRAANDGAGNGSLTLLPCTGSADATLNPNGTSGTAPGATYSGPVSSLPGALTYRVSIAYFTSDPSGKDLSWLQSHAVACPLATVPTYAYVESLGSGAAVPGQAANRGNRGVHATYTFNAYNTNVAGGRLKEYPGYTSPQLCLDAGSANPTVGTAMTMQPCLALGTPQQTWQYRTDLTIYFGGNTALNLCIQAPSSGTTPTLQTCTSAANTPQTSTYPYLSGQMVQEWGFNDNGHFAAALSGGTVTNGTGGACLQPNGATGTTPPASGAALVYVSCDASTTGSSAFDPDPEVGAGKAGGNTTGLPGSPTNQYVNYYQFGRCLDITGQNVNADHLIAYPCKQAPNSANLTFNQVWTYQAYGSTGYGQMYVTQGSTKYCLKAPSSGNFITTPTCAATPGDDQLWQPTGNTNVYETAYRLISKLSVTADPANPKCMAVSPLSEALTFGSSNIITQTCDSSLQQKWNAPANTQSAGLKDTIEGTAGGS